MTAEATIIGPDALRAKKRYTARRERLFQAFTEPERLKKWFGSPKTKTLDAEVDLRVGGEYRLRLRTADGADVDIWGQYEEIVPNEKLVFTWNTRGGPDDVRQTQVTVEFIDHRDSSEVVVTHLGFRDEFTRDMHRDGWCGCFESLEAFTSKAGA